MPVTEMVGRAQQQCRIAVRRRHGFARRNDKDDTAILGPQPVSPTQNDAAFQPQHRLLAGFKAHTLPALRRASKGRTSRPAGVRIRRDRVRRGLSREIPLTQPSPWGRGL